MFAAIRRASSRVSNGFASRSPYGRPPSAGGCRSRELRLTFRGKNAPMGGFYEMGLKQVAIDGIRKLLPFLSMFFET